MAKFEEQLKGLEGIVEKLEQGDLPLEENVKLFERGVQLSNACKAQLASAESRIQMLLEPAVGGAVQVQDLALAVADDGEDPESEEPTRGLACSRFRAGRRSIAGQPRHKRRRYPSRTTVSRGDGESRECRRGRRA